jgi:hypothetical protein
MAKQPTKLSVETLAHDEATRKNIPTAEYQRVNHPHEEATMTTRTLARTIPSVAASDGAGVKLRRSLGNAQTLRHDPFLMLDEFFSDDPNDYRAYALTGRRLLWLR